MDPIDLAVASLESLKVGEKPNYTRVAKEFDVNRSTLSRRHRGVQGSHKSQYENQQLLNEHQEKFLVNYLEGLSAKVLPASRQMIWNFAHEICGKEPGKEWVARFLKRQNNDLVSKWTLGIDKSRSRADSVWKYTLYFELLRRKLQKYEVEPRHMYNMDEKGFLIGILGRGACGE